METLGRLLLVTGGLLVVVGLLLLLAPKVPGLGRLPGDIYLQKGRLTIYIPVVTMLLVSLVLTILLNLLFRLFRG